MRRAAYVRIVLAAITLAACGSQSRSRATRPTQSAGGDHERVAQQRGADEVAAASDADGVDDASGTSGLAFRLEDRSTMEESPPPPVPSQDYSRAPTTSATQAESLSVSGTSAGTYESVDPPNIGLPAVREPSPLVLMGYTLAPSVPTRVLLATLELPPGERFVPPVSSCQDTLVYVASGTLDASGTGIASVDAPATLYPGDALRFGPEGDGLVVNNSSEPVRTIVAIARSEDGGPARIATEERGDRVLCPMHGSSDPLSQPQRVASFATSPPLLVMNGTLEVRILLDADAAGAEHAGLAVLTGSSSFALPEHVHDGAAEVLYFEDARGTMHVGDHDVDVSPGVSIYVPEGTPHSFEPSGSRSMRALQFYAPSGPEQRFRGMAGEAQ